MENRLEHLVSAVKSQPGVMAVGLSGGIGLREPDRGSDIDICVYSGGIPAAPVREESLSIAGFTGAFAVGRLLPGYFGTGDYLQIDGKHTWLMYFDVGEARSELSSILNGELFEKQGNYFYPTGRLAMYRDMGALYDPHGVISEFQQKVSLYPQKLRELIINHYQCLLADREDLERAVLRADLLFYHFALDLAIDHLLQLLFALNTTYFPSRKRSLQYIDGFGLKPVDCVKRLLRVVCLGGDAATIAGSYKEWDSLVAETNRLATVTCLPL